jgi:regulator of protease activity HflC (stomatin/prohibitin superfamily)
VLALLTVAFVIALAVMVLLLAAVLVVPQQNAYVVERLGQFSGVLEPGIHILMPFIDVVRARHSLKEQTLALPEQTAGSSGGALKVAATLRVRVTDAKLASYGATDYKGALLDLATHAIRNELVAGALRDGAGEAPTLSLRLTTQIATAAKAWGIEVLGFEVSARSAQDRFGRQA